MKSLQKIVVILLMVLGLSAELSAEVKNFFINGVGNSYDDAKFSRDKIQNLVPEVGKIELLYNPTEGYLDDTIEAAKQSLNYDAYYDGEGNFNGTDNDAYKIYRAYLRADYRNSDSDEVLDHYLNYYLNHIKGKVEYGKEFDALVDKIESDIFYYAKKYQAKYDYIKTLNDGINYYGSFYKTYPSLRDVIISSAEMIYYKSNSIIVNRDITSATINDMIAKMGINKDTKINFISHSQGNLFVNRLISVLIYKGYKKENIRVVYVSSPDKKVFKNGYGITLLEDLVSRFFLNSSSSEFVFWKNPTNYSSNELKYVKSDPSGSLVRFYEVNKDLYGKSIGAKTGHGLVECYLKKGSRSAQWIREYFLKNYKDLKALDSLKPEKRENLWLNEIVLKGYGDKIPQMKKIRFDSRVHYSSNEKPDKLKVKICYALSKKPIWDNDFVRGPLYSTKTFTTKESSQKISNVSFYIPKTVPLGDYYILAKVDCLNQVKETDEEENQIQFKKIKVVAQEKEDIRTTNIRLSGKGTGKIVIKNTMVYDGSNPDIGWVYQAYFFSNQPKFSTSKQFFVTKAKMGWGKNARKNKQLTVDISKLPVGTFYIWVVVKKLDNSHDDKEMKNNYFRISFTTQAKSK